MKQNIAQQFGARKRQLAILLDPDSITKAGGGLLALVEQINNSPASYIFVGGSLSSKHFDADILQIKQQATLPVVLFPGSLFQLSPHADAVLLLSLISGRNADYLVGHHVIAAQILRNSGLEILPTGYMLIGNNQTSVQYMSNTQPIPAHKTDIIVATAMAGEMLGLRFLYLEAGSGAANPIAPTTIAAVREAVSIPIIVGGGIRTAQQMNDAYEAGANVVVIGTAFEQNNDASFFEALTGG